MTAHMKDPRMMELIDAAEIAVARTVINLSAESQCPYGKGLVTSYTHSRTPDLVFPAGNCDGRPKPRRETFRNKCRGLRRITGLPSPDGGNVSSIANRGSIFPSPKETSAATVDMEIACTWRSDRFPPRRTRLVYASSSCPVLAWE